MEVSDSVKDYKNLSFVDRIDRGTGLSNISTNTCWILFLAYF